MTALIFFPLLLPFFAWISRLIVRRPCVRIWFQRERLDDSRIRLASLLKLLQSEFVVVILVHLVKDLLHSLFRGVLVLFLRLCALKKKAKKNTKLCHNGKFLALVCYALYVVILSLDSFQFQCVKGFENIC